MAETGRKKSFLLFYDYEDFLEDLTDEEMGILLRAIFAYERRGKEPQFSSSEMRMAFKFIRRRLDEDRKNYLETCQKRAQAGAKGGKARAAKMQQEQKEESCGPFEGTQANASYCWHMQANQADTETDTETDTIRKQRLKLTLILGQERKQGRKPVRLRKRMGTGKCCAGLLKVWKTLFS